MSSLAPESPGAANQLESPSAPPLIEALKVLLITRLLFFSLAYAATWLLATSQGPASEGVFEVWSQWDAEHIARVARYGYTDPATHSHATVFFPLVPLLIRGLSALGFSSLIAGLLISVLASWIALTYIFKLAEEDLGPGLGRRAALYMALFPTALFLIAPYSESVFLAGAIPAFYYARKSQWLKVAIPAAVAMGSRNGGIFLVIGLAAEYIRQRDFALQTLRRVALSLCIGVLPLILYGLYLWHVKGDFFFWVADYRSWGRTSSDPLSAISVSISMTSLADYPTNWMMAMRGEIFAVLAGFAVAAWTVAKREWGYFAFVASLLFVMITSTYYWSSPRLMLQLFPSVLFLVDFTRGKPGRHEYTLAVLASLATLGVIVYTHGGWFY